MIAGRAYAPNLFILWLYYPNKSLTASRSTPKDHTLYRRVEYRKYPCATIQTDTAYVSTNTI